MRSTYWSVVVAVAGMIVIGIASFAVGAIVSLFTLLVGQAIFGGRGVSLGTIIRRSAGAIAILIGLLFVLPAFAPLLPASIRDTVAKLLPYNAGQAIFQTANTSLTLSAPVGLAMFALYAAAALTIGTVLVRRRDA